MTTQYTWRGSFTDAEVNALHAEGFDHRLFDDPWNALVERHSLGWVTARDTPTSAVEPGTLVGFVNLPWDGLVHAFLEDTLVASTARHTGIGTQLVAVAAREAKAAGCEWLHVDFDDDLESFYFGACGFVPTKAGLLRLA